MTVPRMKGTAEAGKAQGRVAMTHFLRFLNDFMTLNSVAPLRGKGYLMGGTFLCLWNILVLGRV